MVHRHYDIVRAAPSDAVRQWADLEGKSPTTRDDLFRGQRRRASRVKVSSALIGIVAEILAGTLHVWWQSLS